MKPSRLAAAALVLGALVASSHASAHADPQGDAQQRAAALRAQLQQLQQQAELATEQYDAAYAKLGAAVTEQLLAERDLAQAQQAAGVTDQVAERRVRALYMAGGATALYAQVLDSSSIVDVAASMHQVGVVLQDDGRANTGADALVASRARATQQLAQSAAVQTALQKVVAAKADAVRALVGRTDALLATADQQVRDIMAAQQQQAEAAAALAAGTTLASARAAMGNLPENVPDPQAAVALAFARAQLGKPYVWGATGPDSYDCSGLTQTAYRVAGVSLPRVAADQWNAGPHVPLGALMPGDLLFWATDTADPTTIHHVAMYVGGGLMIEAPHTGALVREVPVYLDGFIGAIRPPVA